MAGNSFQSLRLAWGSPRDYLESYLGIRLAYHVQCKGSTGAQTCVYHLVYTTNVLDQGGTVGIGHLDFSNAFDTVPHNDLIRKLYELGLHPWVVQ